MSGRYLQFSLGPVQSFVAQARRTRDFWAGSFLLSWLSGVAMLAVRKGGGRIVIPAVDEGYLAWLQGEGEGEPPRHGNVPNRFTAWVPYDFDPRAAQAGVMAAWEGLAEEVWRKDLQAVCGAPQREIWDRQIRAFWQTEWVLTDDLHDSAALDRRKFWRSAYPPAEPGIKCTVMDGWQELSGAPSPRAAVQQREFWAKLRATLPTWKEEIAERENLCAIAFVKRRFAHCFDSLSVSMPGGWTLKGWKVQAGVPSVAFMAAVRWLEKVILNEPEDVRRDLLEAARKAGARYGEWHTDITCLQRAYDQRDLTAKRLTALDGSVFFESVLRNPRQFDPELAQPMLSVLKKLQTEEAPTPYFAVLAMDGDSLGVHLSRPGNAEKISAALARFTPNASSLVGEHNGFLIYAGGDDVLAVLPLEDALPCATALRRAYDESFEGSEIPATLSGAVVFAHFKTALTRVLQESQSLLKHLAKEARGRDAIAASVVRPGGKALEWGQPWAVALAEGADSLVVEELTERVQLLDKSEPSFSSKFFFKIRQRFDLLNPETEDQAKQSEAVLQREEAVTLMAAEYLLSGANENREIERAQAEEEVRPLLSQCRPVTREVDEEGKALNAAFWPVSDRLEADGALLIRFLASKGVEV